MELNEKVEHLRREQGARRTFSFTHQGEKLWVKQAAPGEKTIWHSLLFWLARCSGNPYLTPTVVENPAQSLAHEADKLTSLRRAGIMVPRVIIRQPDFLVLSDGGRPVKIMLEADDKLVDRATKEELVRHTSAALAALHNAGLHHSRPALRDMTWQDGRVYFVDFEENLTNILTPAQAIIRDACIYIHTLFRAIKDDAIRDLALDHYLRRLDPAIWASIHREASKYRAFRPLLRIILPLMGKDGRALYQMHNFILNHP